MDKTRQVTVVIMAAVLVLVSSYLMVACARPAPPPTPAAKAPASPAAPPPPAPAAKTTSAEEFFKNNTIVLIGPQPAGSGLDITIRMFATFWPEANGGKMVVVNKEAGGGIPAINEAYKAKPDGLTLVGGPLGSRIIGPVALKDPLVAYDVGKFNFIGVYNEISSGFAIRKDLPHKSMEELQKTKVLLKMGTRERTNRSTVYNAVAAELFGLNVQIISGYQGSNEVGLAMGKGELDAECYPVDSIKDHLDKGWAKLPFVMVAKERSDIFPDVPTIEQVMKLTPEQQKLLDTLLIVYAEGRVIFGPPGIPDDRLQYLRDGFDKVMALKSFRDAGKARWGSFSTPVKGKDVAAQVAKFKALSPDDIAQLDKISVKYLK